MSATTPGWRDAGPAGNVGSSRRTVAVPPFPPVPGARGPSLLEAAAAAALIAALATSFLMGLLPKRDYPLPLHVDEWAHYGAAETLLQQGPTSGSQPLHHEAGFQLVLMQLHILTGLDWFTLFRWLPPLFFSTTALLVYVVARRFGSGLEAAFLVALVPTTIRFLGPAFLVPVAFGLLALPLLLFLLHAPRFGLREASLCALVLLFVSVSHPVSAPLLGLVVLAHAAFAGMSREGLPVRRRLLGASLVVLALAVPASLMALWRPGVVEVLGSFLYAAGRGPLPPVRDAVSKFGALPTGLALVGVFVLALKGGWKSYALISSLLALLAVVTLYKVKYVGNQSVADRAWLHLLLLLALIGGCGLSALRTWMGKGLSRLGTAAMAPGLALSLGLVCAAVVLGFRARLQEPYYHLVDRATLTDFLWIKEHLAPQRRVAVLRTDLAFAYTPLTGGGKVYAIEAWPFLNSAGREAMYFLYGSGPPSDDSWWRRRGIGLIYAPHWGETPPYLDQPRPGVYVPSQLARPP